MSHGTEGVRKKKRREGGGDYKGYRYPTSPAPRLATDPLLSFFVHFFSEKPRGFNSSEITLQTSVLKNHVWGLEDPMFKTQIMTALVISVLI